MAGVQADADPLVAVHHVDDRGDLFERRAERRALSGRVLEQHQCPAAATRGQQLEEPFGDQCESGRL